MGLLTSSVLATNCKGMHFVHNTSSMEVIMVMYFLCHAHWFACVIHIRWNCVHGLLKLLVVYWLGLSIAVRVRVKTRNRAWIFHCFVLK